MLTNNNFFSGLCGRKQKEISKAIKKAHAMGELTLQSNQV